MLAKKNVLCCCPSLAVMKGLAHLDVTCSSIKVHVQILDLAKLSEEIM